MREDAAFFGEDCAVKGCVSVCAHLQISSWISWWEGGLEAIKWRSHGSRLDTRETRVVWQLAPGGTKRSKPTTGEAVRSVANPRPIRFMASSVSEGETAGARDSYWEDPQCTYVGVGLWVVMQSKVEGWGSRVSYWTECLNCTHSMAVIKKIFCNLKNPTL